VASHRRTAAAAVATILASVSLYPIFAGMAWFWAGCGSVAVAALAGTATRVRRLPVLTVLPLSLLVLLLYLNLAFANAHSLYHLLPTPSSLAALWDTANQGFSESSRYAPPVPELRGMVLLAAAGIGLAAVFTDLIAVYLGSAAMAGLPLLLLFTEPFTLSVSRGFLGTVVAFCATVAGYLALLSSEARDRIRDWEQAGDAGRDGPDTRPLAAAGRRVGFAAVALALCVPVVVPGLHVTRLFAGSPGIGGQGGHGGRASAVQGFPNPYTQVTQELLSSKNSTVLGYKSTASAPDYLQIYTLDALSENDGFRLFGQSESLTPVSPRLPPVPGLSPSVTTTSVTTHVAVLPDVHEDDLGALPAPYPATSVTARGTVQADRSTLMVLDPGTPLGGLDYTVTSSAVHPTAAELDDAGLPPADITRAYGAVPSSFDALKPLAEAHVQGAATPYEEAIDLQNWLASSGAFGYTLAAPTVHDAASLRQFLTVTKAGYCQQFAYSMAVLARLLGIPSRYAEGFTSGTRDTKDNNGTWVVTAHDAHAWPELYFQGYGWLRFEPTPYGAGVGQGTAYAPAYTTGSAGGSAAGASPTATASSVPSAPATGGSRVGSEIPPNVLQRLGGESGEDAGRAASGGISPWAVLGLVLAGLLLVAAVAPWLGRGLVRRRRWRSGRGRSGRPGSPARAGQVPADRVRAQDIAWAHAAWEELRDDLVDYGAGYRPSESPRATAARAGTRLSLAEPARSALDRIAAAEERARYAPAPTDGSGLRADSAAVRRAIAAAVPRLTRWRARLLPSSVVGRTVSAVTSAGDWSRRVRRAGSRKLRRTGSGGVRS
jgi:transglutaminase-like putative cysteine protease